MSFLSRLSTIRTLYRRVEIQESSYLFVDLESISSGLGAQEVISAGFQMAAKSLIFSNDKRFATTQAKAPPQAQQMGALKVSMLSPGIIHDPYAPREAISFWRRWFTRNGWRRTKEDIILELGLQLRSAYAVSKLRKSGYNKQKFYKEAVDLYKEINTLMAKGDKTTIRKAVTEKMYSTLKNEIKHRESIWSEVYWELVEPIIKIRTLRARLARFKLALTEMTSAKSSYSLHLSFWLSRNLKHMILKVLLLLEIELRRCFDVFTGKMPRHSSGATSSFAHKLFKLQKRFEPTTDVRIDQHSSLSVTSGYLKNLCFILEHIGVFAGGLKFKLCILTDEHYAMPMLNTMT
ncbi:hypothetical protein JRO89_XS04G0185800 [Xanthoceras sorbifolium]|uniref:Large ribosomal subunit protein mL45 n=1 Tax=Xanthoceras sorbifolium TaxID=99658 RepID=A0ABQ8I5V2_9ROSI|nr:hypothetical protein JRO89_XS04G0185800 [Xanthoceras sorbifolium]